MLSFDGRQARSPRFDRPSGGIDEARTAAVASKFRPAPPPRDCWGAAAGPLAWLGRLFMARRTRLARPEPREPTKAIDGSPRQSPRSNLREQFGSYAAAAQAELTDEPFAFETDISDWSDENDAPQTHWGDGPPGPSRETEPNPDGPPPSPGQSLGEALAACAPPDSLLATAALTPPAVDPAVDDGGAPTFRVSAATLPPALLEADFMKRRL